MDISQVYGGDSLKAADLQGREFTLVIASIDQKEFEDGKKLIIRFQGAKKALICNKTNANLIADGYGKNTDNWIGRPITLYPDRVPFQGTIRDAIRVRPPRPAPVTNGTAARPIDDDTHDRVPTPPMRRTPTDLDDEIPF